VRSAIYIPTFNGRELLAKTLRSLEAQSRPTDVVIVDNGSTDGTVELLREEFPEVALLKLDANRGFGPALNRAVEERPADPVILLNNDVEADPRFVEALLNTAAEGVECVAGVLVQEAAPGLIDSAGVVADRTLMGFDYLHGEPLAAAAGAADPLGPSGGAALYRLDAFRALGGFDERIFLYYEDLDLALRLRVAGARCRLAAEARAVHAYSAGLGAGSGDKYARTGWSRGYMLRRYGVMSRPRDAARVLLTEGAICLGQALSDRTLKGTRGRLRGWREGAGLERRPLPADGLLEISAAEALRLRRRRRGRARTPRGGV
jgi:N-acetylglucosaminyl-diphospho-decaprenol L-rhamnosyltransferase